MQNKICMQVHIWFCTTNTKFKKFNEGHLAKLKPWPLNPLNFKPDKVKCGNGKVNCGIGNVTMVTHVHLHLNGFKYLIFRCKPTLPYITSLGQEWTINHQCTSWLFYPLDGLRFFIQHQMGFITFLFSFFLLPTTILFPLDLTSHIPTDLATLHTQPLYWHNCFTNIVTL